MVTGKLFRLYIISAGSQPLFSFPYLLTHVCSGKALRFLFKASGRSLRYHLLAASDNTSVTTPQTKT